MRVLHVDTGREMRGGQWQVLFLHRELLQRGMDSLLLCPAGTPLYKAVLEAQLPVRPLRRFRPWPASEITHAHDARSHTWAALRQRRYLIVSRRVAFPIKSGALSRWKYRQPFRFVAISRFVRGRLQEAGVAAERVRVVYDGVALPASPAGGDLILSPASADSRKGGNLVQEAARLAGIDVHFSHDLTRDLPRSRLFVYLSYSEGLGSAALLAAAHGVPVIASEVEGLNEAVEQQRTGLLVPNDPSIVAAAIRSLLGDAPRREAMGQAGRRRIEQGFTIDKMVLDTIQVYREALA